MLSKATLHNSSKAATQAGVSDSELLKQLDVQSVDFTNLEEILSFAHLLCQSASRAGMFLMECQNKTLLSKAKRAAKDWIKETRKQLPQMTAADALEVINNFDIIHRIAYGIAADREIINKYTLAAFESRIRSASAASKGESGCQGHREVNVYTLFRQITAGIKNRDRAYYGRPLQWQTTLLDRWHKEFSTPYPSLQRNTTSSPTFYSTSSGEEPNLYDTIQKVTLLLESDLWIYETNNEENFKRRLVKRHQYLLENTETYGLETRKALQKFLIAGLRYGLSADYETHAPTLSRPA